jgi:hypothetical protein
VSAREEKSLDELEVECDGDPLLARGRLSGHVQRLVQRGLLERTGPRTYRRVVVASEEEPEILRHFEGIATLAQLVLKVDGRVSASGMKRVKEEVEMLVRGGSVERVDGGYRRCGDRGRAEPAGVEVVEATARVGDGEAVAAFLRRLREA